MIPWRSIVFSGTCTSWSSFASYTLANMPSRWCSSRPQFAQGRFGIHSFHHTSCEWQVNERLATVLGLEDENAAPGQQANCLAKGIISLSISDGNVISSWCIFFFWFMHTRVNGVDGLPLLQTSHYLILKVLGLLINKIGLDLRSFVEPRLDTSETTADCWTGKNWCFPKKRCNKTKM